MDPCPERRWRVGNKDLGILNIRNCSEQAESLADEAVRTDLRCEQIPIGADDFHGFANRICEGTEQIRISEKWGIIPEKC